VLVTVFLDRILGMPALLTWGLFPRCLALVYLVTFISLSRQVVALAGADGIQPVTPLLRKIRQDYPGARRFLYVPTLLWIKSDDWCLRSLVALGIGGALWVVLGGPWSSLGLLICWACYLSLNHVVGLVYPWDSLLLEAGFLGVFLPSPNALPDWSASALPLPVLAAAFRWLLFRVLIGFGKLKFLGMSRKEFGYLKSFFIAVPLPTTIGWHAHHLPRWAFRLGLVLLFLVEVPTPLLIFVPGYPRLMAAAAIVGLMLAIHLTGNYGHFNLLVIVLCLPLLDSNATLFDQPLAEVLWPWSHALIHGVVVILFIGSVLYFPSNSWCSLAWLYWPSLWTGRLRRLSWLFAFYRFLAPFRLVHAYGVFPPFSDPPVRAVPVIEGTRDGMTWQEYPYRNLMTGPLSAPVWIAPFHPRLDHYLFYEASGTDVSNFFASTFAAGNPYHFSRSSALERLVQRLLEGSPAVARLLGGNPFPDAPPIAVRVNLYLLEPTSPSERRRTGAWWRRRYLAPHLPAVTRDETVWNEWLPDPELFHWDELIWKLRAPRLKWLYHRARSGASVTAAVVDSSAGILPEHLDLFWNCFLLEAVSERRPDWTHLPQVVDQVWRAFSDCERRVLERVLARLSLALCARVEPFWLGDKQPRVECETYFELGLLMSHIIAQGKEIYESVFHDPSLAVTHVPVLTPESGLFLSAIFWREKLAYHARKFRMLRRCYALDYLPGLPGFMKLIPFLAEHFELPGTECYPTFVRRVSDGEWQVLAD
jgi:hypothetical protein